MKRAIVAVVSLTVVGFGGCEITNYKPPPVTASMARNNASPEQLSEGRALFVSRCIDCHSLPAIPQYSAEQWPALVSKMAGRAHLRQEQTQVIVAYILAARAQQN